MSNTTSSSSRRRRNESGFTLIETSIAMVIMMVVGLAAASLFAYATNNNSAANDRELAMAVAQKRLEWLRNMPFSTTTRNLAYSFPNGGLGQTSTTGTVEQTISGGRTYMVTTIIRDTAVVPVGLPDAGAPVLKTITVSVTPQGSRPPLGTVRLTTQRSTLVPGTY